MQTTLETRLVASILRLLCSRLGNSLNLRSLWVHVYVFIGFSDDMRSFRTLGADMCIIQRGSFATFLWSGVRLTNNLGKARGDKTKTTG